MHAPPIVRVTYQGKPLTQRFYDAHPEIQHLYPSKEEFLAKFYIPLCQKMQESKTDQLLEISETSIRVNGEPYQ